MIVRFTYRDGAETSYHDVESITYLPGSATWSMKRHGAPHPAAFDTGSYSQIEIEPGAMTFDGAWQ